MQWPGHRSPRGVACPSPVGPRAVACQVFSICLLNIPHVAFTSSAISGPPLAPLATETLQLRLCAHTALADTTIRHTQRLSHEGKEAAWGKMTVGSLIRTTPSSMLSPTAPPVHSMRGPFVCNNLALTCIDLATEVFLAAFYPVLSPPS
jgi:hypothetical protein